MVKDLYDNYPVVKELFEEADDALHFSLTKLIFEGPDEELMKTSNTQPAILTASTACCRVLQQEGLTPDIAAGHSLGEYSALVAAGSLSFADAVRTVRLRGQFMQEAVPLGEGAMAAILGLDEEKIKEICAQVSSQGGVVQAVNFNCPGQTVIAGSAKAVETAADAMKEPAVPSCSTSALLSTALLWNQQPVAWRKSSIRLPSRTRRFPSWPM